MADQSLTIPHEYLIILKCNGHYCLLHLHAYVSYGVFLSVALGGFCAAADCCRQMASVTKLFPALRCRHRYCEHFYRERSSKPLQQPNAQSLRQMMLSSLFNSSLQARTYICCLLPVTYAFNTTLGQCVCMIGFVKSDMCVDNGAACTVQTCPHSQ